MVAELSCSVLGTRDGDFLAQQRMGAGNSNSLVAGASSSSGNGNVAEVHGRSLFEGHSSVGVLDPPAPLDLLEVGGGGGAPAA